MVDDGRAVLRRYRDDGSNGAERLLAQVRKNRAVIRFAAGEALHPGRLRAALGAYRDALARQDALFTREGFDDITDAMRHAGGSALVVDRIARRGTAPDVAASFMRRLGIAHERDSRLAGARRAASEAIDLHNNELGISVALDHLGSGRSTAAHEQALEGAVLRALADGRALVLDAPGATPRASTGAELAAVLREPSRLTA